MIPRISDANKCLVVSSFFFFYFALSTFHVYFFLVCSHFLSFCSLGVLPRNKCHLCVCVFVFSRLLLLFLPSPSSKCGDIIELLKRTLQPSGHVSSRKVYAQYIYIERYMFDYFTSSTTTMYVIYGWCILFVYYIYAK